LPVGPDTSGALGADAAIAFDQGVDALIETFGGEVFDENFQALAPSGRYLLLGSTRAPAPRLPHDD
jgi:NADPH2:quinone reductase